MTYKYLGMQERLGGKPPMPVYHCVGPKDHPKYLSTFFWPPEREVLPDDLFIGGPLDNSSEARIEWRESLCV